MSKVSEASSSWSGCYTAEGIVERKSVVDRGDNQDTGSDARPCPSLCTIAANERAALPRTTVQGLYVAYFARRIPGAEVETADVVDKKLLLRVGGSYLSSYC